MFVQTESLVGEFSQLLHTQKKVVLKIAYMYSPSKIAAVFCSHLCAINSDWTT